MNIRSMIKHVAAITTAVGMLLASMAGAVTALAENSWERYADRDGYVATSTVTRFTFKSVKQYSVIHGNLIDDIRFSEDTTVTYHADTGSAADPKWTDTTIAGDYTIVGNTHNRFTRDGYEFQGWSQDPKATAASLRTGGIIDVPQATAPDRSDVRDRRARPVRARDGSHMPSGLRRNTPHTPPYTPRRRPPATTLPSSNTRTPPPTPTRPTAANACRNDAHTPGPRDPGTRRAENHARLGSRAQRHRYLFP